MSAAESWCPPDSSSLATRTASNAGVACIVGSPPRMYRLLKELGKPLFLVAMGGASYLVVLAVKRKQAPQAGPEEAGPEELGQLLLLNEQLEDPASPEAREAVEASWGLAGHAADRVCARALCARPPSDFMECGVQQLLEFLTQAGVKVVTRVDADHVELNFTPGELALLARARQQHWEFQRFKLCMRSIMHPTICSQAMLRIRQLMPPPSSRNAVARSAILLQQALVEDSEQYVWDLPFVDRVLVHNGELESELEEAVGVMIWEVECQEERVARRNARAFAQVNRRTVDEGGLLRLGWGAAKA